MPNTGDFVSSDLNSNAFEVALIDASGAAVTLSQPIKLVLRSRALPTHPTLGEVANVSNGQWQRVGASFFRAGSQSAAALTSDSRGTYRVAFRGLPRTSGEADLFGWDSLFKNNGTSNNALASQAEAAYDLVMHGNGAFGTAAGSLAPELSVTPPQSLLTALGAAETARPGNDISASKLLDVQAWMRSIVSPAPVAFDEARAEQGFELFNGKAACCSCHKTSDFTGPGTITAVIHPGGGLAGGIKISGLRGVVHTAPYLSNGSVATLIGAVEGVLGAFKTVNPNMPTLTDAEKAALVEYLKSL